MIDLQAFSADEKRHCSHWNSQIFDDVLVWDSNCETTHGLRYPGLDGMNRETVGKDKRGADFRLKKKAGRCRGPDTWMLCITTP